MSLPIEPPLILCTGVRVYDDEPPAFPQGPLTITSYRYTGVKANRNSLDVSTGTPKAPKGIFCPADKSQAGDWLAEVPACPANKEEKDYTTYLKCRGDLTGNKMTGPKAGLVVAFPGSEQCQGEVMNWYIKEIPELKGHYIIQTTNAETVWHAPAPNAPNKQIILKPREWIYKDGKKYYDSVSVWKIAAAR